MVFNDNKMLDKNNNNSNNIMNLTIGILHESGYGKLNINPEAGGDLFPVGCINKKLNLLKNIIQMIIKGEIQVNLLIIFYIIQIMMR